METGPFWLTALAELIRPFLYVTASEERVFWLYLLTSVAMGLAALLYFKKPGGVRALLKLAFPRRVYWHPSARADYVLLVVNNLVEKLFILPFIFTIIYVAKGVHLALLHWVGPGGFLEPTLSVKIAVTVAIALAGDFALFIVHWMQHRSPVLWEFHKVHHSAGVLTPVTAYRFHPIDTIMNIVTSEVFQGVILGLTMWSTAGEFPIFHLLGLNLFVFLFYFLGYNLRHSHVWLPYPGWLSRVVISPAQHQIHHSKAPQHWDKNMGFMFAFWDVAFRTLYVPQEYENIAFGLGNDEHEEYPRVRQLYFLPFVKAWRVLTRRKTEDVG